MKVSMISTLLLAAGLLATAGAPAFAQDCPAGCGRENMACLQTARADKLACKQACRSNPSGGMGACMKSCMTGFHAAKAACQDTHGSCTTLCPPPPPPSSCTGAILDTCGRELATCAQGVITQVKTCLHGCASAADRLSCFQGCAAQARAGAQACGQQFEACVHGHCPPPPGSTTTTTLPPLPCGLEPFAATCGGACPPGLTCAPLPTGLLPIPLCGCVNPSGGCRTNADCSDGNPCTLDLCVRGTCVHECLCLEPTGASCCPGPLGACRSPSGAFLDPLH
ncbi:MAG TPA: hypothetical protein VKW76_02470 [Candidatus Binatia bacterium]|nr:hypothetical protein [Candidatus Binatia bacterium]